MRVWTIFPSWILWVGTAIDEQFDADIDCDPDSDPDPDL